MKVGDIVGIKNEWYFNRIHKNTIECKVAGSVIPFYLSINSSIVKDCIGEYDEKFYEKTIVLPDINKRSMLTDMYETKYHFIENGLAWINVGFYNSQVHGKYLTVRAELHPFNKDVKHAEKKSIEAIYQGDKTYAVIMRKLNEVDDSNELMFSAENEAIVIRTLKKKMIDYTFCKYMKIFYAHKEHKDILIEKILSKMNQMCFSSLITGKVTNIYSNEKEIFIVFTDDWNLFVVNAKLLIKKDVF
jgi:hypothetical protein